MVKKNKLKKNIKKSDANKTHVKIYAGNSLMSSSFFKVFPRIMFVISLIILCNGILISSSVRDVVQNGLRVVTLRWFKFE